MYSDGTDNSHVNPFSLPNPYPYQYQQPVPKLSPARRFILSVLFTLYSICVIIYCIDLGARNAKLVAEYYDYSSDGTPRVSIDSFPRDIYKNTKDSAVLFLVCAVFALLFLIGFVISEFYKRDEISAMCVLVIVMFLGVCGYSGAFLSWKYNDLSDADRNFWNSIDPRFVKNLHDGFTVAMLNIPNMILFAALLCFGMILKCKGG